MDAQQLLLRTSTAAKQAREQGFENAADALDEIAKRLLEYINASVESVGKKRSNFHPSAPQIH